MRLDLLISLLIVIYMIVVLPGWSTYNQHILTSRSLAVYTVVTVALAWFSPVIAMFYVIGVLATIYVNERAKNGMQHSIGYTAVETDFVEPVTVWPYLPTDATGSNLW